MPCLTFPSWLPAAESNIQKTFSAKGHTVNTVGFAGQETNIEAYCVGMYVTRGRANFLEFVLLRKLRVGIFVF